MKRFFKIYSTCLSISISRISAYRANFILNVIITLIGNLAFPLVTLLIYNSGSSFPGWDFYEVLLIQSTFTLSSGVASMLFSGVLWETMSRIKEGSYEMVLLRPINPLLLMISSNFSPESSGIIIGGLTLLFIAISNVTIASSSAILMYVLLFLCGCAVMTGFSLLMAATSFKWVANSRLPEIFDSVKTFGKYPLGIFPGVVRNIVTFIIPVGMIGFYPAGALLGRIDTRVFFTIIPCFLFMILGICVYQFMIRLYEGVGG